MAASNHRSSAVSRANVNLYCAQCDSQIGIFDNEWIRLTTSYARAKENGTHFGTEVGNRTQVVPKGPAQRLAEGCVMAEVFCRKCSNMVGQYCKSAPDEEKHPLVDQYFYKLSRTFLKDSRTFARIEPVFGYGSDIAKPTSARSSMMPGSALTPPSRWADTPMRQSSRTPAISLQGAARNLMHRESSNILNESENQKGEQTPVGMQKLQRQVNSQQSALSDQSIQIDLQTSQLSDQENLLREQQTEIAEHESCLSAQAARIVEQDGLIKDQARRLEQQQIQISTITLQLNRLNRAMDDLRRVVRGVQSNAKLVQPNQTDTATGSSNTENPIQQTSSTRKGESELQALRMENQAMKTRLKAMAGTTCADDGTTVPATPIDESASPEVSQNKKLLGKRKRNEAERQPSQTVDNMDKHHKNATRHSGQVSSRAEQMLTPQSSDSGQQSPEQMPSAAIAQHNNQLNPCPQRLDDGTENSSLKQLNISQNVADASEKQAEIVSDAGDDSRQRSIDNVNEKHGVAVVDQEEIMSNSHDLNSLVHATRRRNRAQWPSQAREVAGASDGSSLPISRNEGRRVTRSFLRAGQSKDAEAYQGSEQGDGEAQHHKSSLLSISAGEQERNSSDSHASQQPELPSAQAASIVSDVDSGQFPASSQALTQGLESRDRVLQFELNTDHTQNVAGVRQPAHLVDIHEQSDEVDVQNSSNNLCDEIGYQEVGTNQRESALGSDVHRDVDDSDIDDELMQLDAVANGDDPVDADAVGQPDHENNEVDELEINMSHHLTVPSATRKGRNMAPEPVKGNSLKAKRTRSVITIDPVHNMTPKMFADAYASGHRSKLPKSLAATGRNRELDAELTVLGLTEWIGKRKRDCKEYRDAVTAARARLRDSKIAAYLQSKGLSHNTTEPSAILPQGTAVHSAGNLPDEPPMSLEDKATPSQIVSLAQTSLLDLSESDYYEEPEEQSQHMKNEQPRTTRASRRRSSAPLLSGLETIDIQMTGDTFEPIPHEEASNGKRKRNRKGRVVLNAKNYNDGILELDDDNRIASVDQGLEIDGISELVELETDHDSTSNTRKPNRSRGRPRKSLNRGKRRPRKSATTASTVASLPLDKASTPSELAVATPVLQDTQNQAGVDKANSAHDTSIESQAQRDDIIRLRDQMAKELMELEEMSV